MTATLRRPCLSCGSLVRGASYCPPCAAVREAARPTRPTRVGYDATERKRRAAVVKAWRASYGDTCPGWDRPAHPVVPPNRLSADHVTPVAVSGNQAGPLGVLCLVCNGRKGART